MGRQGRGATQRQLDRGRRLVELLKQPQYEPFTVTEQILSVFAGTQGFLDDLPLNRVAAFEKQLLAAFRDQHPEIGQELTRTGALSDELDKKIREVIKNAKAQFVKEHAAATA